ncbi:B3 domain-containing protein At2g16210 [Arabidopsis lyrata subsp. lyrata]|uniref:B3 domain-containing protein At2g16210 n=1 Tax=Arabidopsis lyrata subsp. lyrata TaxID=81972 RepID=UPI000A29DD8A|nr:B3 domain-containing protein At2g16210 [Arabidopsis lyrata subsp. lyrata]|eukprot:XP_020887801.1 B3 domain-containing protein At2g16210 [Arabidopsis lyrata subsp. lyrata]
MAINPDYLRCKEERNNESFFKVLQSLDVSSENLKIRAQWGSSWEVAISKNPRFYYLEKSGWGKFVRDNALGNNEFITFTHKGKMRFTLNIFKQDGKEMMQPPQSSSFLASSSRGIKTEQREDDKKEEVVVSSELSPTTAAESNGGTSKRNLNLGKKKARGDSAGASSSSVPIPTAFDKAHMPKENAMFKIHHPDGKRSWNVTYLASTTVAFSAGWICLIKEYPIVAGVTCKLTLIKPDELLLVVLRPEEETE